jgi:hypothetical protein
MRTVRRPVHAEAMPPPHPSPRRLSTYEPVHGAAHLRPQRLRAPPTPARAPRATATTGQNGRRAGRERRSRPAAPPRRCRRPRRGMSPRRRPRTRTCLDDGATWRGCRKRERLPSEALLRPATTVRTLRGPAAATRDTVRSEVSAWCLHSAGLAASMPGTSVAALAQRLAHLVQGSALIRSLERDDEAQDPGCRNHAKAVATDEFDALSRSS